MRKIYFIIFAIFLLLCSEIQAFNLSDQAKISLITCDPGQELYSIFGHTAIRVHDSVNKVDKIFNYGTFDFSTPNFYFKFLLGNLNYALTVNDFQDFYTEYQTENRTIFEQEVLLPCELFQQIYDSLNQNALTKNRYYRYDFFRDNCSTRAFNLLLEFADHREIKKQLNETTKISFRQALKPSLAGSPWLSTGINFLLGPFADKKMTKLQTTFLPEPVMKEVENTGLANAPIVLFQGMKQVKKNQDFSWPMIIFWLLAFLLVAEVFWLKTSQKTSNRIDLGLFTTAGIFGLLLLFLWIYSLHVSLRFNLNILWANPLLLVMLWTIPRGHKKISQVILLLYGLLMFFLMINWNKMPQKFPLEMMPVVTLLAFRAISRVFQFKKKSENPEEEIVDQV
jgi:hypothetical protein